MMPVARTSDIGVGICTAHTVPIPMTGIVIGTAYKSLTNNLPTGLMGDIVIGADGHVGIIIPTTIKLLTESKFTARMGDPFVGSFSGTIITGSPNYYSD